MRNIRFGQIVILVVFLCVMLACVVGAIAAVRFGGAGINALASSIEIPQDDDPAPTPPAPPVVEKPATEAELVLEDPLPTAPAADNALVSACQAMADNLDPFELNGFKPVRQGLPMHDTWRDAVLVNGAEATSAVWFGDDYASVTLDRVVPDDEFIELVFCPIEGTPIDLLPLVEMTWVTTSTIPTMPADLLVVLASRGVNVVEGEILQQNMYAIHLGAVQEGSFIFARMEDDPELGVNNGGLFALVADTTYYALDLAGQPLPEEELTFFPEALAPAD